MDPSYFRRLLFVHYTICRGLSVAFQHLNVSTAVILLHLKDDAVQQVLCLEGSETLVLYVQKGQGFLVKMNNALSTNSEQLF